nr:MAG TPA: hypothetical protein [Caudoviricetes sp.]
MLFFFLSSFFCTSRYIHFDFNFLFFQTKHKKINAQHKKCCTLLLYIFTYICKNKKFLH